MKIKNLFILPLLAGLMLVGCKNNKSEVKPSEPEVIEPSEPEVVTKTVEEVVADINGIFNPLVGSDILSWYDAYNCYIGGLNLGAAEHATDDQHAAELQEATEFVVSYLPEYLTVTAAGYEEEQDDYYIGLSVDEIGIDTFGYIKDSNIIVQIQVALIAE